jgi:hypothetical protein
MKKNKNSISKILTALILAGIATSSFASDNSIYIDQSGDNATITMVQDGAANRVKGINGSNSTPAIIYGDGATVDITQTGSGNSLDLGVKTGQAGGISSSIKYIVTGNTGTAVIDMNSLGSTPSLANSIDVLQVGDNTATNIQMTGSNNYLKAIQTGGNNNKFNATVNAGNTSVDVNQTGGGGNETTLNLTGNKGTVDIVTVGASNIIGITQSGGGVNGHYAKVDLNGSSNNVSISQSGSIDMNTNIKSAGNGNTFSIIQRN